MVFATCSGPRTVLSPRKTPGGVGGVDRTADGRAGGDQGRARTDVDRAVDGGARQAGEAGDGQRAVVPAGEGRVDPLAADPLLRALLVQQQRDQAPLRLGQRHDVAVGDLDDLPAVRRRSAAATVVPTPLGAVGARAVVLRLGELVGARRRCPGSWSGVGQVRRAAGSHPGAAPGAPGWAGSRGRRSGRCCRPGTRSPRRALSGCRRSWARW